mgnify:CR=1 FL=1
MGTGSGDTGSNGTEIPAVMAPPTAQGPEAATVPKRIQGVAPAVRAATARVAPVVAVPVVEG